MIYQYDATFLVDTGAAVSVIFDRFFTRNNLHVPSDKVVISYRLANGSIAQAPLYYADYQLGNHPIRNIRTAVIKVPSKEIDFDGIIGQNILENFQVNIDHKNQIITLEHPDSN